MASLHHALHDLQAVRLNCEVFSFNAAVLAMHRRHGFIERDLLRVRPSVRGFDFLNDLQALFLSD